MSADSRPTTYAQQLSCQKQQRDTSTTRRTGPPRRGPEIIDTPTGKDGGEKYRGFLDSLRPETHSHSKTNSPSRQRVASKSPGVALRKIPPHASSAGSGRASTASAGVAKRSAMMSPPQGEGSGGNKARAVPMLKPRTQQPQGTTQKAKAEAIVTTTDDQMSANIFRNKLQSIMAVRQQIEALTQKHKADEEALGAVINSILTMEETHRSKSQQELLTVVQERDRTIQMLAVFREEGNAVIHRMHESLKHSVAENEAHVKEIEALRQQLKQQHNSTATPTTGAPGEAIPIMSEPPPAELIGSEQRVQKLEHRCQEYHSLLQEADDTVQLLRNQIAVLQGGGKKGTDGGSPVATPPTAQQQEAFSASDPAPPTPSKSDVDHKRIIDDLKDQLRREKQARLEAEEQSHKMIFEQQRHIEIMEQRLNQANQQLLLQQQFHQGAGGSSASSAQHPPRPSVGGTPPSGATPRRYQMRKSSVGMTSPTESETSLPSSAAPGNSTDPNSHAQQHPHTQPPSQAVSKLDADDAASPETATEASNTRSSSPSPNNNDSRSPHQRKTATIVTENGSGNGSSARLPPPKGGRQRLRSETIAGPQGETILEEGEGLERVDSSFRGVEPSPKAASDASAPPRRSGSGSGFDLDGVDHVAADEEDDEEEEDAEHEEAMRQLEDIQLQLAAVTKSLGTTQ